MPRALEDVREVKPVAESAGADGGRGRSGSVILLLGAGASYEAGMPLLGELTDEVRRSLPDNLGELFDELLWSGLPSHERANRNIEDVLTAADGLASARLTHGSAQPRDFALLAHEVRKRIWGRLSEPESKPLDYLDPIRDLVDAFAPLTIASLNNDRIIERWASSRRLSIVRGFDERDAFDRRTFGSAGASIVLLKIHGSVDWAFEPEIGLIQFRGNYRTPAGKRLFHSPVSRVAAVFPSRLKVLQALPLRELLVELDRKLSEANVLVVAGCKLGDEHIIEAIVEASRKNGELRLLLVDPKPREARESLLRGARRLSLEDRIDFVPRGLGDALKGGLLRRRIEASLPGERRTLGCDLVRMAEKLSSEGIDCKREIRGLLGEIDRQEVSEEEIEEAAKLVCAWTPSPEVSGPTPELLRRLSSAFASNAGQALKRLRGILTEVESRGAPPAGEHLTIHGGEVFFVGENQVRLLIPGEAAASLDSEPVSPKLIEPRALAIRDDVVVYSRGRCFGGEGLRRLIQVDLRTGRRRGRFLLRTRQARVLGLLRLIASGPLKRKAVWPTREEAKAALLAWGWLNWARALRWMPDGNLVIAESRSASIASWPGCRVVQTTGKRFLNLVDAAVSVDGGTIFLLEAGVEGEGRLVAWRPAEPGEKSLVSLVEPLEWPGGLALDRWNRRLLVTLRRSDKLLAVPLAEDWLSPGPLEVLAERLWRPHWVCCAGDGVVWVSTGLGILSWRAGPAREAREPDLD